MKMTLFVSLLVVCTGALAFAQNPVAIGQSQINAGIGFSGWGTPVYVGLDYGVHKDVTVGGDISYRSFGESSFNYTIIGIFANGNYHFNQLLKIPRNYDLYAGISIGFFKWSLPDGYSGTYTSGLGWSTQIGGRYYFTNSVAAHLELGGGNTTGGKLGVSFKL